jgi:hypothetical protein
MFFADFNETVNNSSCIGALYLVCKQPIFSTGNEGFDTALDASMGFASTGTTLLTNVGCFLSLTRGWINITAHLNSVLYNEVNN